VIADDPKQRRVGGGIDGHLPAVQCERDHEPSLKQQTFSSDPARVSFFFKRLPVLELSVSIIPYRSIGKISKQVTQATNHARSRTTLAAPAIL
jgi:hypothetical protein